MGVDVHRARSFSLATRGRRLLAIVFLIVAPVAYADPPRFLIGSVRVEGLHFASSAIVVSESRIVNGRSYSEPELRDALARIQRLPFVMRADFSLRRGSVRDEYVLVVTIEEMKPLFVDYGVLSESIGGWTRGLFTNSDVYRHTEEYPNLGARLFVGPRTMILMLASTHGEDHFVLDPVYGVSVTQYDLFGTRASASAAVRYRESSFDVHGYPGLEGREGMRFGDHLLWDFSVAAPIAGNQAIRAEAHREYRLTVTGNDSSSRLTQVHYDVASLVWIYNSTNDFLFPTRGTYGEVRGLTQSDVRPALEDPSTDTFGIASSWKKSVAAQVTHYYPLTGEQALVFGGDASKQLQSPSLVRARAGYTALHPITVPRLGSTALHAEVFVERVMPASQTNLTAGVAIRNSWGILHFDFRYLNIGGHSP